MLPLRILQVCSSLAWGGTEMHLPILASKLQERGHAVLAVVHPKGHIRHETDTRGIPTVPLGLGRYINPVTTTRLIRLIRQEHPDILHLHLSRDLWQVVPATRWTGRGRVILTKHVGSYINKHDPLHRWLYHHVDRIITVSDILHQNVVDTCPIPQDRVVTIHHALDLRKYDPTQYRADTARQAFGIRDGTVVIGTVGRITPGKGYEEFLHAAQIIRRANEGIPIRFLIVGSASYGEEPYFKSIVALSRKLGLADDVIFTGYRRDIPQLLRAMDIFVFPSRAEGLGATLIEAMAMGVACVSTNSDGTQDIIEHQTTGLTIEPGDHNAMAQAALALIRDAGLRKRMAAAGRSRVEEKFDLETMTTKIENVYQASLQRSPLAPDL